MASQTTPSTPGGQAVPPAAPSPPTGTWRHPRLEEITRRQQESTFGERNLRKFLYSLFALMVSFYLPRYISFGSIVTVEPFYAQVFVWVIRLFRLLIMYNGLYALRPLVKATDDLSDIPLTPNQRALLGLGPSSTPATPGGAYITPPRYSHSTPLSSSSRAAVAGSSPLGRSNNGSPISGSPLADRGFGLGLSNMGSPTNSSPLVRKLLPGQRYSLGDSRGRTPSLGGLGLDESSTSLPPTPSPSSGQRAVSVSLNNKWLYQRQKASPGGKSLYI